MNAIVAIDDCKTDLDDSRRQVRYLLDLWAAWITSRRSHPRQSSIADIGRAMTESSGTRTGNTVHIKATRTARSKIPEGVEASETILRVERALQSGEDAGLSRHMMVVKHCHFIGAHSERAREIAAVERIKSIAGISYHIRTLQTLRAIGESYLIAKLL